MMVWLPYESFEESARSMDSRTLTIQRFDAFRLLSAITKDAPTGMRSTPCFLLWRDHPLWLASYGVAVSLEWERQANRPSELTNRFRDHLASVTDLTEPYPRWLGDSLLHLSHRSNMIRLSPEHYQALWPGVIEGLPLFWGPMEGDSDA